MENNQKNAPKTPSVFKRNLMKAMTAIIVVIISITFYFILFRFNGLTVLFKKTINILKPIIYGLAMAYVLSPIVTFWEKKILYLIHNKIKSGRIQKKASKIARSISILLTLIITVAIIIVLCLLVFPELINSIYSLIRTLPGQLQSFERWFMNILDTNSDFIYITETAFKAITDYLENWLKTDLLKQVNMVFSGFTASVINLFNAFLNLFVGMIVSIYVLSSKELFIGQVKKAVYALFTAPKANYLVDTARASNRIFSGFISGKLIDSLIIGLICFLGCSILDMPYTVLVSVVIGVTNIIPFFGPYIGGIPTAFLILLASPLKGVYFILFIIILQQIDGNIIGPKILGNSTGLSAFWVVFSILLGGGLFGFPGMILGVPVFAVIYYIISNYINRRLADKELPTDSYSYCSVTHLNYETAEFDHMED